MIETLTSLFNRDLNRLRSEIEAYQHEEKLWHIEKAISNSAGNLCLHLIGNLNTYIGAEIGKTNYIRNRELEFSLKNIRKAELISKVEDTILVIDNALKSLKSEDLEKEYPLLVFQHKTSVGYLLVHLSSHLTYHLGQISYHRRLLDVLHTF